MEPRDTMSVWDEPDQNDPEAVRRHERKCVRLGAILLTAAAVLAVAFFWAALRG